MAENVGARQVGEFLGRNPRQVIRSMKNPIDKSTIVSIYPKEIYDRKHTIEPGEFRIPAGSMAVPGILAVGSSSWWSDRSLDQPMLEIPVSSVQVANAVVNDYANGLLGCNMGDHMPGLFFVLGEQSVAEVKDKYKSKLAEAKVKQDKWFNLLVTMADSLWARANGNPIVISDEMRVAARELNLNERPWIKDTLRIELIPCVACGGLRNPQYPICSHCRSIDTTHPLAKELKFATP